MNIDTLKIKSASWSEPHVAEFYNLAVVPGKNLQNNKVWEYADNGLYIISGESVRYYGDNGIIQSFLRSYDNPSLSWRDRDQEILEKLYDASLKQDVVRIAKLIEFDRQTVTNPMTGLPELREFRSYQSPDNQLGIPLLADFWQNFDNIDDDFVKTYIDQLSWFITTLKELNCPFPKRFDFSHRLKNDNGYYFYDLREFTKSYEEFVRDQIEELIPKYTSKRRTRPNILPNSAIKNIDALLSYAEAKLK